MKTFEIVSHISSLWISSHPQSSTEWCFQYFNTEKSFCVVMCCPKPQPMEFHPPKSYPEKQNNCVFLHVFFWFQKKPFAFVFFSGKVLPPLLFPFQFQNCCFESMLSFRIMIVLIVLISMIFILNVTFVCVCGPAVSVDIAPKSQTQPELIMTIKHVFLVLSGDFVAMVMVQLSLVILILMPFEDQNTYG